VASEPTNMRLWQLCVMQAKTKFAKYPSPAASHWVHEHYVQEGGRFMDSSTVARRKELMAKQFERKKKEHAKNKHEEHKKKHEGKHEKHKD